MAYRISYYTPITEKTTTSNARMWLNMVKYSESGAVINPQDDSEYRIIQIIENKKILKKILGKDFKKYILLQISVDNDDVKEVIKKHLIIEAVKKQIRLNSKSDIEGIVSKFVENGFEIGLFIYRINKLLDDSKFTDLLWMEYLLQKSVNLSIILFFEKDVTNPRYIFLLDKCSMLFDHIHKYKLYSRDDGVQFIKYNNSMWNMVLDEERQKQILDYSGCHLWIISHLQRYFRDNPKATFELVKKDDSLMSKLQTLWNLFSSEEQEILIRCHNKGLTSSDLNSWEYDYFKTIGFIKIIKNSNLLGIPVLELIIEKKNKISFFKVNGERIIFGNDDITSFFTREEIKIFSLFIINSGEIITREKIAKSIWFNNWEDKYSDWAIDRIIFRLRKKLQEKGIGAGYIKTKKRKGFIFG